MNPDYTAFDAELLRLIKACRNRMMMLFGHKPLLEMARPFCFSRSVCGAQPWRVIYRRIQALRKDGKIEFNGKAWEIVEGEAA